jgi:hypothetical protein
VQPTLRFEKSKSIQFQATLMLDIQGPMDLELHARGMADRVMRYSTKRDPRQHNSASILHKAFTERVSHITKEFENIKISS